MARSLRLEFPGAFYHLYDRGNERRDVFMDDGDRLLFLDILGKVIERFGWVCHGYCLMCNHYHILIETPVANLSAGMRQLNGVYTQSFNRRHHRVGHLFQGRFGSSVVDRDSYYLELCRYIVLNPVRAGLAVKAEDCRWSSHRAIMGMAVAPRWLAVNRVLAMFGNNKIKTARRKYAEFVADGINASSPWKGLVNPVILGDEDFVRSLLEEAGVQSREIPADQRNLPRPSLETVFAGIRRGSSKAERDRRIAEACHTHYYKLSEIARFLGLHYAYISRLIKNLEGKKAKGKT